MPDSESGRRLFRSYTSALRHPVLVGRIAEWRLPWILSVTQLGAMAATAFVLVATGVVWARFGGVVNLVVFGILVVGVGWAVRRWRVEGRTPIAFALSLITLMVRRRGVRNGQTVDQNRGVSPHVTRLVVAPPPDAGTCGRGRRGG